MRRDVAYLPREIFFGRLGLAGGAFFVWVSGFGPLLPGRGELLPVYRMTEPEGLHLDFGLFNLRYWRLAHLGAERASARLLPDARFASEEPVWSLAEPAGPGTTEEATRATYQPDSPSLSSRRGAPAAGRRARATLVRGEPNLPLVVTSFL